MFFKRLLAVCLFVSVVFCAFSASAAQYHIHKNAPHKSYSKKLDAKGLITEYYTDFYGGEIIMKHTVSFLANGQININGYCTPHIKINTPDKGWNNTTKNDKGQTVVTCYYYSGKIKAVFTITNNGNGNYNVNYTPVIVDPNI